MGGGSARFGFWALVLHVLFAWFYAVSCFGSEGVRYRSIALTSYSSATSGYVAAKDDTEYSARR